MTTKKQQVKGIMPRERDVAHYGHGEYGDTVIGHERRRRRRVRSVQRRRNDRFFPFLPAATSNCNSTTGCRVGCVLISTTLWSRHDSPSIEEDLLEKVALFALRLGSLFFALCNQRLPLAEGGRK